MNIHFPAVRFEPHRARLLGLARHWLGNAADAQDAVQDTWLRAQSGVPPSLESDAAWLVTVLRHLCVDRLRRRQLESREALAMAVDEDHAPCAPSPEHVVDQAREARAALRRLAAVLPADDLAALLLHAVFDFEHREIAHWAGQSEAAMRQRVHRALRRARARPAIRTSRHPDAEGAPANDPAAEAAREALFSLCWRALHGRDAAGLIAQVRSTPAPAPARASLSAIASAITSATGGPTIGDVPAPGAATRSGSQVVQLDGGFALAWILDGVVLCAVPMGPLAMSRDEREAVAA